MSLIVCECGRGRRGLQNHINATVSTQPNTIFALICLYLLVYGMGGSVGGLERLHHLFLPGCRRSVQGETLKCLFCLVPDIRC